MNDKQAMDMIIERIYEEFAFLSDNAKTFIKGNTKDIDDFYEMIQMYQRLTKDSEQYDDFDNMLLNNLQFLVQLLKIYV